MNGAGTDQIYLWKDCLYVPLHAVRLAAGPFLPASLNEAEQHVRLPPDFRFGVRDRSVGGVQLPRRGLAAARVHGDSMVNLDVYHGDIAIFQRHDYGFLKNRKVVVIEKVGDDEGWGAWALKRLLIKRSQSAESENETDWDEPVITLLSANSNVSPAELDPSGQYRVHGIFLRSVRRDSAVLVNSATIRHRVMHEK